MAAANSIFKLRVESSEYDAKLANAAKGIRHLADVAHQSAKGLTDLKQSELGYIQALGSMETRSRTASGQVRELSNTYKELKVIYDQLSNAEKSDEGGRALAASLEQIKQRAQETKAQLDAASQSLQSNGQSAQQSSSILDVLKDKLTFNVDALKLFDAGLSAVNAAISVAGDAFASNEELMDEWGQIVEASRSIYDGFLNALNTGDISGYLNNISQIVQAAREAYDALDELETFNAFNQVNVERTRTGMTESIADFRSGIGSKDTVKAAGEAYKKELEDRKQLEKEAYLATIKRVAAERGVSAKDLTDALSGTYGNYQNLKNVQPTGERLVTFGGGMFGGSSSYMAKFAQNDQERLGVALRQFTDSELQRLQALGAQAERTGNEIAQVDRQLARVLNGQLSGGSAGGARTGKSDAVLPTGSVAALNKEMQELQKQQSLATDTDSWKKYQEQIDTVKTTIASIKGELVSIDLKAIQPASVSSMSVHDTIASGQDAVKAMRGQIQSGIGTENAKIDTTTLHTLLQAAVQNGIDSLDPQFGILSEKIGKGIDIPDDTWEALQEQINEKLQAMGIDPIQIDFSTGNAKKQSKEMSKDWSAAANAIQAVGSAMSQIEDPAAKVVGTIAQAIATIALGYAQATTQAATAGPWAWIAFAATGLATMISTITAIHSATGYANGGVVHAAGGAAIPGTFAVPGTTYSGDQIPAMLNAGEVVLTRAQAGIISNAMEGGGVQALQLSATISGEDIRLALNNNGRRTGRGEYVTTHFR